MCVPVVSRVKRFSAHLKTRPLNAPWAQDPPSTDLAHVGLLPRVNAPVFLEMLRINERCFANVALIRPFSCMGRLEMIVQQTTTFKAFATVLTESRLNKRAKQMIIDADLPHIYNVCRRSAWLACATVSSI